MPDGGAPTVTLGGKGATALTSAALYTISAGRARLSLDSSSYDRLSVEPSPPQSVALRLSSSPIPPCFSQAESRASLAVLLNKLLASSKVRPLLPDLILGYLNSSGGSESVKFETLSLTEEELYVVEGSCCGLYGVFGLLDHQATSLSAVINAVAALSCEAVRADVGCFNLMDSGDGFVSKEEIGVASDLRVLLNGSKLVGKAEVEAVSSIPKVNGVLRKVAKAVHAESRINLNSAVRKGKSGDGSGVAVANVVLPLADVVFNVGKSGLSRTRMNLNSIGNDGLKNDLGILFESKCVKNEDLREEFKFVLDSYVAGDYNRFVHEVLMLLGMVWNIVAWEVITAFVVLEGGELVVENKRDGDANGIQVDKKSEKKKKKVVLGKGTSVVVQFIKDMLQRKEVCVSGDEQFLEKLVRETILYFDIKDPEFDDFLTEVKDIVDSNESRRLTILPKGSRDFAKQQMEIREKAFSIITEVFKKRGATALDTPVFELRETVMGNYWEDSKWIYDLADQVKVNHRKLLDGMLEICDVPPEKVRTICSSIDKLDKQPFEQIRKEMIRSIAAGGQYDNLIGMFGKKQVPAFGVSLGIEWVFAIMEQLPKDQNQIVQATGTEVLVGFLGDDLPLAAELVSEFWDTVLKANYLVKKRVMKHVDYARELKILFMVLAGERELSEGVVKLKDIDIANEEVVPRNQIVEELKKRL